MSDNSFYKVFDSGTIVNPLTTGKELVFYCVDPRLGEGVISIYEGADHFNDSGLCKMILNVPVKVHESRNLFERIYTKYAFDKDVTLDVVAHGAIVQRVVQDNIYDLCFNLRYSGSSIGE